MTINRGKDFTFYYLMRDHKKTKTSFYDLNLILFCFKSLINSFLFTTKVETFLAIKNKTLVDKNSLLIFAEKLKTIIGN